MKQSTNNVLRLAIAAALAGGAIGGAQAALLVQGGTAFTAPKAANELPTNGFSINTAAAALGAGTLMTSFVPTGGQNLTVNVNLDNGAKFVGTPTLYCSALGGYVSALTPLLGGAGNNQAVFSITETIVTGQFGVAGPNTSALGACYVSALGISVTGTHTAPSLSITYTYGALGNSTAAGTFMTYNTGLSASKIAGTDVVATVASGFVSVSGGVGSYLVSAGTLLWNGNNSGAIGTFGTQLQLSDALASGSITVAGASLVATKATAGVWLSTGSPCSTAGAGIGSVAGGTNSVTFNTGLSAQILSAGVNICMQFDGVTAVPAGSITATMSGTPVANYSLPSNSAMTMMTVSRNGSSTEVVNLPPSTNADAGYLRVYNNSSVSGAVTVTVYNEAGTALATGCSLGTLAGQSTMSTSVASLETTCSITPPATGRYRAVLNGAFSSMRAQGLARTAGVLVNLSADSSSSSN